MPDGRTPTSQPSSLISDGFRVRVRGDSPTAWGGQTGVVTAVYEGAAHVLMDASKTIVLLFRNELEADDA